MKGGKRENSGAKKKFVNHIRESNIPEKVIQLLEYRLETEEVSTKELISLLQYFQPRLSVQRVEMDNNEESKQIDITTLWLNKLEDNDDQQRQG